jgi:hypothetical protein
MDGWMDGTIGTGSVLFLFSRLAVLLLSARMGTRDSRWNYYARAKGWLISTHAAEQGI